MGAIKSYIQWELSTMAAIKSYIQWELSTMNNETLFIAGFIAGRNQH